MSAHGRRHGEQRHLGTDRDEIRRHLDGRDRAHPARGGYRQTPAGSRARGGRGRFGDGGRNRPSGQLLPRGQCALRSGGIRRRRRIGRTGNLGSAGADAAGDGLQGTLVARLAGSDQDRRRSCQGPHRGYRCGRAAGFDGIGRDRGDPRLPGRFARRPRDDAGTWRFRHLGRGRRCRRKGRPLRHLYRRRRCLHHRPAHRRQGAQAAARDLRGNAGAGLGRLQSAADPLGLARHEGRRKGAGAVLVHR